MQSSPLNQPSQVLHRLVLPHQITVQAHKVGSGRLLTNGWGDSLDGPVQGSIDGGRGGGCCEKY